MQHGCRLTLLYSITAALGRQVVTRALPLTVRPGHACRVVAVPVAAASACSRGSCGTDFAVYAWLIAFAALTRYVSDYLKADGHAVLEYAFKAGAEEVWLALAACYSWMGCCCHDRDASSLAFVRRG